MKLYYQILFVTFFGFAAFAKGEITTKIFFADSNSPVAYQKIMVGTELSIILSSDTAQYWDGSIALMGESVNKAALSDANYLTAAGNAEIYPWENEGIRGYELYTEYYPKIGDWFIFKYTATHIGDCNVAFFDGIPYNPPYIPTYNIEFTHVPTRDFDGNTKVDFSDFALFASQWNRSDCQDPNYCYGADIDTNGTVDVNDLMLFTEYWLKNTK